MATCVSVDVGPTTVAEEAHRKGNCAVPAMVPCSAKELATSKNAIDPAVPVPFMAAATRVPPGMAASPLHPAIAATAAGAVNPEAENVDAPAKLSVPPRG